jgi:subtilisin family serine protease
VRVYQFRHIRADGQCSGARGTIFGLSRGLPVLAAAALALPLAVASAAGPAPSPGPRVELVVTLEKPPLARTGLALQARAGASYVAAVARGQRAFVRRLEQAVPDARVRWHYQVVVDGLAVVAPAASQARIAALPGVADVYPSVPYRRTLFSSPAVIGAPQLWGPNLATAGEGIKIGIIDDGVDQTHPFFSPAGFTMPPGFPKGNTAYTTAKVIAARAFAPPGLTYRNAKLPFDPAESFHATHVAGIAAGDHGTLARGPNGPVSVSGIAPRAYLGNYKVLTIPTAQFGLDGNSPEIVAGIEAAVRDGMNVINLSLGEPEITPARDIVIRAIDGAAAVGVVPVIAAGNEFAALGFGTISSPGSAPKAITAAAASKSLTIASFSSAGPTPYSLRLKPDVSAPGVSILSSVPRRVGLWDEFDGTSMAAPHVAGAAALLRQRHPGWTVAQIKSALVLTGNPVRGAAGEVPPTREGGGMIWLPRADQPLVFASPSSFSLGYLRRGQSRLGHIALTDAGGGAGTWSVALDRMVSTRGVTLSAPSSVVAPGDLSLRASASRTAAAGEEAGFLMLTHAGQTRRIPYWLHLTAHALARERHALLRRPGVYRGNTRRGRALVTTYRFPTDAASLGVRVRLPGPEQVFRFVIRRRVENAGARVLAQARGVHVSPRLVRAGDEDQLTGFPGLPIRLNPYQPGFYGVEPVVGVFRPARGAYDVVFDTASRRAAGTFTFRFWLNDTRPPSVRLSSRSVRRGGALRLVVRDSGSGVDPQSLQAEVDRQARQLVYDPRTGSVELRVGGLARGRHRLLFTAADYQETKNTEDSSKTLPNTRRLSVTLVVR